MDVEVEGIESAAADLRRERLGGTEFLIGKIGGTETVAAQSGVGKVNAAFVASVMALRFGVDAVIMMGIAGGIGGGLSALDAFVPTGLVQHDVIVLGCEDGYIDVVGKIVIEPDALLSDRLAQACGAKRGLMATGEQFVNGKSQIDAILARYPDAIAVDMEAAAVAQVCARLCLPFACVKVISDDGASGDRYYDFRNLAAKKSTAAVLSLFE